MRWFLADVLGLFSINVGPFSRNVVPSDRIFSINLVPKQRMFSVPVIYVLGPLHVLVFHGGSQLAKRCDWLQVTPTPEFGQGRASLFRKFGRGSNEGYTFGKAPQGQSL